MGFKKIFALTVVLILGISSIFVFDEEDQKNDSSDGFTSVMPTGTDINLFWQFDTSTGKGPFGCFYGAVNRYDGANNDDSTEARLSTEKGAIGYILNPNDWTRTLSGNTFTNSLYNTMLIIPPVYWYSELDSGGGSTGKLYMANTPDAFPGKTLVDYAHTYTSGGVVGHAPAIGIGVYKGMTLHNSVTDLDEITSVRLGEPTTGASLTDWVTYSNNASVGNDNGTYQVCNFYQWTLYKLMCHTILGNMDSQYMMGCGLVFNENLSEWGTYLFSKGVLSSPYTKSTITTTDYARASPVSLLIENPWGGMTEYIGDMTVDSSGNLSIGNTLGGVTDSSLVQNALNITVPANVSRNGSDGYIDTFNSSSEVFGLPSALRSSYSSPGNAINDMARVDALTYSDPSCTLVVSGGFTTTQSQIGEYGLSSCHTTNLSWSTGTTSIGARLGYVFEDDTSITSEPFAYIMDYNTNGTISDIRVNAQGKHIVQIDVNNPTYGSVSSSLISVDDNSVISVMDNEITIGTTTITATPSSDTSQYDYEFDIWSGIPGSWEVTENMVITANFVRSVKEYDVSFNAVGPGQVSEISITVPYGTVVSEHGNELTIGNNVITATPMPSQMGYTATLDYWNYPLTITGDCTIYAIFSETLNSYTITINVNNSAYGSVSESTVTAYYGDTIYGTTVSSEEGTLSIGSMSVTALANPTAEYIYEFVRWDNIPPGGMVENNCTITAIFSATVNYISVDIYTNDSNYGTVSPSSISVPYGSQISTNQNIMTVGNVTVTATPSPAVTGRTYQFNFWEYYSSEITEPTTITAWFSEVLDQCHITFDVNNTNWGSVSQSTLDVSYGTTITVNGNEITFDDYGITTTVYATPFSESLPYRYTFSGWSNVPTGNVVLTDTTISANFTYEVVTYDVTIQVMPDSSYGTVSETTLTVTALSSISVSNNTLTIESSTVTATPHARTSQYTYAFDYWDYQEKSYVDSDMTIYANFNRTLNMYTITIQSNNTEYGNVSDTVISAGYGTVIRANGSTLQIGSQTVTATPEPQSQQYVYSFNNWTRNNQQISVVNVNGDMTIVANFIHTLRQYTVSFTIDESGWGSVSPSSVRVPYGTGISSAGNVLTIGSTSVTASPSATTEQYVYSFDTWLDIPLDRLVTDDTTITAKFTRSEVDYEITITAGSGGSVSESRLVVPYGTSISANGNILSVGSATVTATPDNATAQYTYTFGAWGGVPVSGIITAHTPITASFVATVNEYTVTISVNESTWGTVSDASVTVPYGTVITTNGTTLSLGSQTVTATPTQDTAQYDYGFRYWLSNYQPVHNTSVNGNMDIVANFSRELNQYTVTIAVNENGWGTVSPTSVTVPYGTAINPVGSTLEIGNDSVTATPSQSDAQYVYDFSTWDDVPASRVVNGNMTITAVFIRSDVDYEVLIIAGEGGTVSQNRLVVPYGTTVSTSGNVLTIGVANITATPDNATAQYTYSFNGWVDVPNGGTITENTSITAQFSRTVNEYTVTISVNESTWGTVSESSVTVPYGTSISAVGTVLTIGSETIIATPTEDTAQYDYEFSSWLYNFQPVMGVSVVGNMQIDANFTRTVIQYTVFIAVNESHWGSVSPSSVTVPYGTEINPVGNVLNIGNDSITATPSQSTVQYVYSFGNWDDVPSGRQVVSDIVVTAVFIRSDVDYEVLIVAGDGGTVSQDRIVVPYGTTVSTRGNVLTIGVANITATPNDANVQYTYTFGSWSGIPNGGIVTQNISVNAIFNATLNQYTVTIRANDNSYGSVSESSITVDYGTLISTNGQTLDVGEHTVTATPTQDTAQYTYDFSNWSYVGNTVDGNKTVTAVFSRTVNQYTVSIVANDITWGSVSSGAVTVDYGTPVSSDGNVLEIGSESIVANPSPTTVQYVYSFTEWLNAPSEINGDVTITAVFSRSDVMYEVSISTDGHGSVSQSRFVVPYGTSVSASGSVLTVGSDTSVATPDEATAQYTYSFSAWNNIPVGGTITDHVLIEAVFSATLNQYTVTITVNENGWGTVSPSPVTVDYGTPISSSSNVLHIGLVDVSATATESNAQYTYTFGSWQYLDSTVTGNMTVTAVFSRTVNQYTVSIVANDITWGSVSRGSVTVNYGTLISSEGNVLEIGSETVTATPSQSTAQYSFSFVGWNDIPASGTVTESVIVTAQFMNHLNEYVVTINAGTGGSVSESRLVVTYGTSVISNSNRLSVGITEVVATPDEATAQYTYTFRDWVNIPISNEITESITITAEFDATLNNYTVSVVVNNSEYGSISPDSVTVPYGTNIIRNGNTLELGSNSIVARPSDNTAQYTYSLSSWNGPNRVIGNTEITAQFTRTVNQYTVTIVSDNDEYGSVSRGSVTVDYGTTVTTTDNTIYIGSVSVTANPSPATSEFVYVFNGWYNVPSTVIEDTTVTASFTRMTNSFIVTVSVSGSGTVSDSEVVVPYGTSILPQSNVLMVGSQSVTATPNDPNAQYTYYFSTWDNIPSSGQVTRNVEVTAVFTSIVNQYVVTFDAGRGGSVSAPSVTVDYGTSVVIDGANITLGEFTVTATPNEPDAQYTYTFGYWTAPSTITDTTTIDAYFTATVNQYTVTFVSANPSYGTVSVPSITAGYGAIIQSHENVVEIGPYSATAIPNDATAQYTYYFTEWSGIEGNTVLVADMTITAEFSRIVNDFTITIVTEGNGNVSTNTVNAEYGASITAENNVLTIGIFEVTATPGERTQQYTYYFDSWEGIDGIDSVTEDMEITAQFGYTVNRYTLYISSNDVIYGNVSQPSITVDYGTSVSIDNNTLVIGGDIITATPSQSTVQYTYDFVRWDNIPAEITMDSVGYAIFSRELVNYTVFFNVNESEYGTVVPESVTVPYGTVITSSGNTVTVGSITATATPSGIIEGYSHAFSKWTGIPSDNAVVSDITVTAVFSRTLITVTVTFHATDYGTVSAESMEVDYGTGIRYEENILYVGEQTVIATPYTSDAQYTYRFAEWMGISADTITDNMNITAQFTRTVNQYTVTIGVNSDYGTVSPASVTVDYGTDIIVNGQNLTIGSTIVTATPYEDTSEYSYTFDRWVMESARVTKDMSVTAVFSRITQTYIIHITVVNPDYGTVSEDTIEADYGTPMRIDGNRLIIGSQNVVATPVTSTEVYDYTFGGWSSIGDMVESDMDVTATFHRDLTAWAFSIVAIEEMKDTDSGNLFKTVLKIIPILVLGVLIYIGASRFIRSGDDSDDSDDYY